MKVHRRYSIACVFGLAIGFASAATADPIRNVTNHPIVSSKKLTIAAVREGIIAGGERYHWRFEDDGPGKLIGSQIDGRTKAFISITYDENVYSIGLIRSEGLFQIGNDILSRYNSWIVRLTQNIDREMSLIGAGS